MKQLILSVTILATLCLTNTTIAQNWTVGVPVNQQIIDLPVDIAVTAFCEIGRAHV